MHHLKRSRAVGWARKRLLFSKTVFGLRTMESMINQEAFIIYRKPGMRSITARGGPVRVLEIRSIFSSPSRGYY